MIAYDVRNINFTQEFRYQQSYLLSIDELDGQVQLQVYHPHPVHEEMIILIQYSLPGNLGSGVKT